MRLDYNSPEALAPVIEALLFASDEPLSGQLLRSLILGEEVQKTAIDIDAPSSTEESEEPSQEDAVSNATEESSDEPTEEVAEGDSPKKKARKKRKSPIELGTLHTAVELLNTQYDESARAFRIVEIAGGYQFATRPEHAEYVARLFKEKSRRRLSGASLETLAIIAYKQPVSKLDIENIRGVNCDEVLKSLLEKNLVTITGRAEAVGRPLLYGTTVDFLRHFGLHGLQDLPRPREIEELMKEEAVKATTLEEAAHEFVTPQGEEHFTLDAAVAFAKELSSLEGEESNEGSQDEDENDAQDAAPSTDEGTGIELDIEAMSTEL